ncbi:MAG: HslU--HslV peptidase proteolytic subunit [Candidatus Schekmanbacteria bacterium RIFCSPHIGHO2_02_FULL_38_11]|uniref:ATP-dependent protease subunit HslV n=1 Tax=Candidatus Schekmanbacteria bacterium RIFCSPLOWO2_12_FULL_38_15 TaxID=1817883 RepID=A0A1F7SJY0_9BACT|nr:MAG: HslU--HslV peptidase proteolytic subunit [Candidatus Schekmanbacteria bacterium GWA2_38_9]OGL50939.1 MAG: HslU--HslV peptidase proteolytic subunit [Candidatus Schekmanbacteria bacterium RIFCSPLOWO2_02_FULL_38_14]OGL53534.1 MAG: HslU--HslV peptidase proteolytic subunit [Candidatus Schekmanbacteria bacterium RIFCSPLOWO2_12_FULL_38_15]OGL55063.1 MAG: HslU--HslV peptidase proteolytic subunit [Candidatus Schekmanbacteria bacterium RIFCSPHIGHO2_02_FULL_38_11]
MKGTTILSVRHNGKVAIGGDGQVTLGETVIMKHNAKKVRRLFHDQIIVGFSGASADAFTLLARLEGKLEQFRGNLQRAVVELAKDWRTDKVLRKLEALLAVVDKENSFIVSGTGDIIEPDDGIIAIGSGGPYALAAAKALIIHSNLSARSIVEEAMKIAGTICVYTNLNIMIEEI